MRPTNARVASNCQESSNGYHTGVNTPRLVAHWIGVGMWAKPLERDAMMASRSVVTSLFISGDIWSTLRASWQPVMMRSSISRRHTRLPLSKKMQKDELSSTQMSELHRPKMIPKKSLNFSPLTDVDATKHQMAYQTHRVLSQYP